MADERIIQALAGTVHGTFTDTSGYPINPVPNTATVTITGPRVGTLVSAAAATSAGTGTFKYDLNSTQTATADILSVAWVSSLGTKTTTAEIVAAASQAAQTTTPVDSTGLSLRALCSLADVRAYLNIDTADTDNDPILIRLINAATTLIQRAAGREFRSSTTGYVNRVFEVTHENTRYISSPIRSIRIGDATSVASVTTFAGALLDPTAYDLLPFNRDIGDAITRIKIVISSALYNFGDTWAPTMLPSMTLSVTPTITVNAVWGFPIVPDDIRQACIEQVSHWYSRDVANFGATYNNDLQRVEIPRALSAAAWDICKRYRLRRV